MSDCLPTTRCQVHIFHSQTSNILAFLTMSNSELTQLFCQSIVFFCQFQVFRSWSLPLTLRPSDHLVRMHLWRRRRWWVLSWLLLCLLHHHHHMLLLWLLLLLRWRRWRW
mmetsp:Transcript_116980/g.335612  ORF Transcript_116980/g.335612 Transcript_116980/m.335612 type:complete len:110 (-) Transcript_116980:141-470(-)